ncbi:hypothetical protein H6S82_25545 [Planktothrix sp. FACHB-1355]|uniref:hypothetical protein n=1 Tax=Oscillatoriophycideae TaxID=1301283 RepID=UPI001682B212|nr:MULTISPECIES: hypothetical protein [Oscillatoriales]MBD3562183.1 hypothetical protein [Planktothrix sp. FACHB-1355]
MPIEDNILNDEEAEELQLPIADEFGKIDPHGWLIDTFHLMRLLRLMRICVIL